MHFIPIGWGRIAPKSTIQLHQICIGGENVGKISRKEFWFYKKKKCCKSLTCSTSFRFRPAHVVLLVPRAGVEPARVAPLVFETSASTDSAIWA